MLAANGVSTDGVRYSDTNHRVARSVGLEQGKGVAWASKST